jgi:hypothetical protein
LTIVTEPFYFYYDPLLQKMSSSLLDAKTVNGGVPVWDLKRLDTMTKTRRERGTYTTYSELRDDSNKPEYESRPANSEVPATIEEINEVWEFNNKKWDDGTIPERCGFDRVTWNTRITKTEAGKKLTVGLCDGIGVFPRKGEA